VLSTPPAFILSQDQTLRKCITDTRTPPGKTGNTPAQNSKPAKKTSHHTKVRQPANSTNQKTIGINKLGTLLSSQTTGTNDYSQAGRFHALSGLFSLVVTFTAYFILFSLVKSPAVAYKARQKNSTKQSHDKSGA
jgi:hypothetical protein